MSAKVAASTKNFLCFKFQYDGTVKTTSLSVPLACFCAYCFTYFSIIATVYKRLRDSVPSGIPERINSAIS